VVRRSSTAAPSIELLEGVRQTTLDSGVRVVTEAMPHVRSVTVGYWIGIGSRDERGPVAGASHFLEHLLFKGTKRRTAAEIAEALDAVGGDMNAFTSKEYTCFYAHCLDRDTPLALDVLGDMITSARIRSADVDAERDVVLEEIRMHLDTPDDLVHTVFSEALFGEHPLAREVLGSERSITEMTRDQVHRYYKRHYVPENLTVVAAGNVEHEAVVAGVAEALADLAPAGRSTVARTGWDGVREPRVVLRERPTEQSHLVLGGVGLARGDERRFAASVLNQALGGGMASRLFQEVREKRGLVYSVYSYQGMHTDAGSFAVYAGTAPAKVTTVLDVVRTELDRARREGITDAELERAKGNLAGSMLLSLEDTGSRMGRLGKGIATDSELLTLDETLAAVEAVTHDDVREVAAELLSGPFTLAGVGPVGDLDADALGDHCEAAA
jgi:predicted Zn-dependent peptidase